MIKVGDYVIVTKIPSSISPVLNNPDSTYSVVDRMIKSQRPRKVTAVTSSGCVEVNGYRDSEKGRIYHSVMIEPDSVQIVG